MSTNIPSEAAGLASGVLIYSILCLSLSVLLYIALLAFREYTNYITLFCFFVSISSAASIAQQVEFAVNWRLIKERQFEEATTQPVSPLPLAHVYGVQAVLYWIQYYCYNVEALILLFWAINLGKRMWQIRGGQYKYNQVLWPSVLAKLCAVVIPGILMGVVQLDYILERRILLVILGNACLELSFAVGSVVVIASLVEFFIYRKTVTRNQNQLSEKEVSGSLKSPCAMEDRWMIIRFVTAFVILSIFEVWVIVFQILQTDSRDDIVNADEPDFSMDAIKRDLLTFVPGVTTSAGCFILFGTTAPLRKLYRRWFGFLAPSRLCPCCCAGGSRRGQDREQLEHDVCEIGQRSMAELAFSSLANRANVAENRFVDVWPASPNFKSDYIMSTAVPVDFNQPPTAKSVTAGRSSAAGSLPFSLILPSPPATVRSPLDMVRSTSPSPSLQPSLQPSPSLLEQGEKLMRGDDVFFTPRYPGSAVQNEDTKQQYDDALR